VDEAVDEAEEGEEGEVKALDKSCMVVFLCFVSFVDLAKHLGSKVKIPGFRTYNTIIEITDGLLACL
jgi:hypothetical protein